MQSEPSIKPGVLTFELSADSAPSCDITIAAPVSSHHMFKVRCIATNLLRSTKAVSNLEHCKLNTLLQIKTTQPTCYHVKPNQGLLEPGISMVNKITMVRNQINGFTDHASAHCNGISSAEPYHQCA
jgi:hypothetical protein